MSAVALIPEQRFPLYQLGDFLPAGRRRFVSAVHAPWDPLYQLGDFGAAPQVLAVSAGIIGKGASAVAAGIPAISAAAGPIGLGIGLAVSVIAGFWAAHAARAKGAKTENAQVNSAVQAFDSAMHAIFDAANSSDPAKNITASIAAELVSQQYVQFWQAVCSFTQGPGRADASGCGSNCGGPTNMAAPCSGMPNGHFCDKKCTVSCCVGCQDIKPTVDQAIALFRSGQGGSIEVCNVSGSKYGLPGRGAYTLTWTPPKISVIDQTGQLVSAVASEVTGVPGSLVGAQGLSPVLLLAAGLFLAWKFL